MMNDRPFLTEDPNTQLAIELARLRERVAALEAIEQSIRDRGTYSPTYLGGTTPGSTTYSLQQGFWERHGSLAFVTGQIAWSAATGTGEARISLPFAPSASFAFRASGSLRTSTVTFSTTTPVMIMAPNAAYFSMESPVSNALPSALQVEAAGIITFSLFYGVD